MTDISTPPRPAIQWYSEEGYLQVGAQIVMVLDGESHHLVVGPVRDLGNDLYEANLYEPQSVNIDEPGYVPQPCGCVP